MSAPARVACAYAADAAVARQSCSMLRARVRQIVRSDGRSGTPSSSSTRSVSAFEVGSTIRASTSCLNVSSPIASKPTCPYASSSTFQSTREREPVTVGAAVAAGVGMSGSRSNALCPRSSVIRSRATATSAANWASSCAEPRCSTIVRTPRVFDAICTAVAPDAVRTFRTNIPTAAV